MCQKKTNKKNRADVVDEMERELGNGRVRSLRLHRSRQNKMPEIWLKRMSENEKLP